MTRKSHFGLRRRIPNPHYYLLQIREMAVEELHEMETARRRQAASQLAEKIRQPILFTIVIKLRLPQSKWRRAGGLFSCVHARCRQGIYVRPYTLAMIA